MSIQNLNEAVINPSKIIRFSKLYAKLFSKALQVKKLEPLFIEHYIIGSDKGTGVRMLNKDGFQLRLGFNIGNKDVNFLSKESAFINRIDIWFPKNEHLDKPSLSCVFETHLNTLGIYKQVCNLIKHKRFGAYAASDLGISNIKKLDEDVADDRRRAADEVGIEYTNSAPFNKHLMLKQAKNQGKLDEYNKTLLRITSGKIEKNTTTSVLKSAIKDARTIKFADPDVIFNELDVALKASVSSFKKGGPKRLKSLIICGMAGIGKTYSVEKYLESQLGEAGINWEKFSGAKTSDKQFYKDSFLTRNKIALWDEADNILKSSNIQPMLKSLLDDGKQTGMSMSTNTISTIGMTSDEIEEFCDRITHLIDSGDRILNLDGVYNLQSKSQYISLPSKFLSNSNLIFISNMSVSQLDPAVRNRSVAMDIYLMARDIQNRAKSLAPKWSEDYNIPQDKVLEIIDQVCSKFAGDGEADVVEYNVPVQWSDSDEHLSFRTIALALESYSWFSDFPEDEREEYVKIIAKMRG